MAKITFEVYKILEKKIGEAGSIPHRYSEDTISTFDSVSFVHFELCVS